MAEKDYYVRAEIRGVIDVVVTASSKKAVRERLAQGSWDDVFNIDLEIVGRDHIEPMRGPQ